MMVLCLGVLAAVGSSTLAPVMRLGFREESKVGVDCGRAKASWPSRRHRGGPVEILSPVRCYQCVVENDGTGCDGDCKWEQDSKECVAVEEEDGLSACEWAAIILGILICIQLCFLLLFYLICGRRKSEDEEKRDERRRQRRESLDSQAQWERAQAGEQEKAAEREASKRDPRGLGLTKPSEAPSVAALNPEADELEAVTLENVCPGMEVVRGRSWDFRMQDGGKGTVGVVWSCIKAPHWWMVKWPHTQMHAYFCGEHEEARCDLAVAPPQLTREKLSKRQSTQDGIFD